MLKDLFPHLYDAPLRRYLLLNEDGGGDQGGSGGGSGGSGTDAGDDGADGGDEGGKLSQAEVDRKVLREKRKAKDAALRQVAEDLGVSLEEAKSIIAKHQEAETEALGATEAARRKAEADAAEAERTRREAATDRLNARIERKLVVAAGLDPDDKDDQSRLNRLRNMVAADLNAEADSDAIDEAIQGLRKDFPALFDGEGNTPPPPPESDRGGPSRRQRHQRQGGSTGFEKGLERAKATSGSERGYTFLE